MYSQGLSSNVRGEHPSVGGVDKILHSSLYNSVSNSVTKFSSFYMEIGHVSILKFGFRECLTLWMEGMVSTGMSGLTVNRGWRTPARSCHKTQIHTCTTETRLNVEYNTGLQTCTLVSIVRRSA